MELIFYSDPSHGWIKVSFDLLNKFNLIDKISKYSYVSLNNHEAYLEEDCDASLFIESLKSNNITYNIKENLTDDRSFIRGLRMFNPKEVKTLVKEVIN